jgi:type IV fimbrial biogenesis protein FimT
MTNTPCIGKTLISNKVITMSMKTQRAFTLTELMITIAVAAILMAIALPSMRYTIFDNRVTSKTNELIGALNFARTEAITRRRLIQVQPVTVTSGNEWGAGWKIMDISTNPVTLLRITEYVNDGIVLKAVANTQNNLTYTTRGQVQELNPTLLPSINLSVCPQYKTKDYPPGRLIEIGVTGRATVVSNNYAC